MAKEARVPSLRLEDIAADESAIEPSVPTAILTPDAGAPVKAVRSNPLEQHVKAIEDGKQYLERGLVRRIRAALPFEDIDTSEGGTLEVLLPKLSRLVQKMHASVTGSTDTKEMRDVFTATKDMVKLISSMQESIDAQKAVDKIENAVMIVLDSLDPKLKENFVEQMKAELA